MPDFANLTAARRYAAALIDLARERDVLDAVAEDMAALKGALEAKPEVLRALADKRTRGADKRAFVEEKVAKGRHELVKNLLGILVRRRREALLPEVLFAFGEGYELAKGILRVEVQTADKADEAFLGTLSTKLGEATGRTIALEATVKPELLGGLRLLTESKLVDASIATRLHRLKNSLTAARV
jgi:F-type H+-transporting ATPase subunit delta